MIEQKTYNVVSYNELNEIVEEEFGPGWDFISSNECNNDSSYVIDPENGNDDEWTREAIANFPQCGVYDILTTLVSRKRIPDGVYLIEVCW